MGWGDDWGTDLKDNRAETILLFSHSSSRRGPEKEEEEFWPLRGKERKDKA